MVNLETIGSREISHTLDASRWPVKGTLLQTSAMGVSLNIPLSTTDAR